MRLKKREEDKFFNYVKRFLSKTYKKLRNKKVKILFFFLVVMTLLLIGTSFGMVVSGFFGTLDEPSEIALDIAHALHIQSLREIKLRIEGIMAENIKIPFNYVRGQFSKPEKIYIDIAFENFKKLEYKREETFEKEVLITSAGDYVPATIRHGDKQVNVKLRLKGDGPSHLMGDKWSFRIKVKGGETLFGMKTFSIQNPITRNYLDEFIYHKALKKEGVMAIRYDFIEVIVNGENRGIYALEENFDKQLIESNQRREGILLKFDDGLFWEENLRMRSINKEVFLLGELNRLLIDLFYTSNIETYYNEKRTMEDPELARQFIRAKNLLESFRKGSLETHEVFDIDILAKYFAINSLFATPHMGTPNNIKLYYNPITDLIEPVGYDAVPQTGPDVDSTIQYFIPPYFGEEYSGKDKEYFNLIFEDEIFYKKYIQELERMSQKEYTDTLLLELDDEIKKNINILHKDMPSYHFPRETFYKNQRVLESKLNPIKSLNAFLQEVSPSQNKIVLAIGNVDSFPLEIVNLIHNNSVIFELNSENNILKPKTPDTPNSMNYEKFEFRIPFDFEWDTSSSFHLQVNYKLYGLEKEFNETILPWPYTEEDFLEKEFTIREADMNVSDFLEINEDKKIINIKSGSWILNQNLIIPGGFKVLMSRGTTIDLRDDATIISYSELQFLGLEEDPIKIISSDGTGQGLAVLNAEGESNLKNVYFENLRNPSKEEWKVTGAITFYNSPVNFDNIEIVGMKAEDSLNIMNSKFEIRNSFFKDCFSDCLDVDFGSGIIESSSFTNCGNDCLDISGANVTLKEIKITNAGDKGISVGEKSNLIGEGIKIDNAYIGIAVKDLSIANVRGTKIFNCEYGFAVYQKKSEFGQSEIEAFGTNLSSNKKDYIVEKKSDLSLNGEIITGSKEKIFEELYPL